MERLESFLVEGQTARGADRVETEQRKGLLQSAGSEAGRFGEGDQEGVSKAGAAVASRQACTAFEGDVRCRRRIRSWPSRSSKRSQRPTKCCLIKVGYVSRC